MAGWLPADCQTQSGPEAKRGEVPTDKAEDYWDHLTHLRRNKDRLRYVSLRLAGLPIGSVATVGARFSPLAEGPVSL
jgi:hypothetical protein